MKRQFMSRRIARKVCTAVLAGVLAIGTVFGTVSSGGVMNTTSVMAASSVSCNEWKTTTAYNNGDLVAYKGAVYECIYAHTSHEGWLPDGTPTLWKLRSDLTWSGSGSTGGGGGNETPTTTTTVWTPGTQIPDWQKKTKTMMIGYYHTWDNAGNPFIKLRDVDENWDIINISFSEPVNPGSTDGRMKFEIGGLTADYTKQDFKNDVRALQAKGKRVVLSIGGYEGFFSLGSQAAVNQFVSDITSYIDEYHFDGIDIDLEQSSMSFESGQDPDIRVINSPKQKNMVAAIRTICDKYGDNFILSWAPETFYVQNGYMYYGGINQYCDARNGSYLPMINALRDKTTFVHVQLYNSAAVTAPDGNTYTMGTKEGVVAMCKMLLDGFYVGAGTGVPKTDATWFAPLRPDQVVIGVPSSAGAAGSGQIANSQLQAAFAQLNAQYPGLRGIMSWSINWDRSQNNNSFARENKAFIKQYSVEDGSNSEITTTTTTTTTTKVSELAAFDRIEAEAYSSKVNGVVDENPNLSGGHNIGGIINGTTLVYDKVVFPAEAGAIDICYSSPTGTASGNAEIYVDSLDNKVGTVVLSNNASSWEQYGQIKGALDKEISKGTHKIYIKFVTTNSAYYAANVDYFSFVSAIPNSSISSAVEINGFQISTTLEGVRTVYSVEPTINGKTVVEKGMIYSIADKAAEGELKIGSTNTYVKSVAASANGEISLKASSSATAKTYAMTMLFSAKNSSEYSATWRVRAYAKLSDGTYVYSNAYTYKIYDVASKLYDGMMSSNYASHAYLYEKILRVVNPSYTENPFDWSLILMK